MKRIYLFIIVNLLVFVFTGCNQDSAPENRLKIAEPVQFELLIAEIKKQNIPYKVAPDNVVYYPDIYDNKVMGLFKKIVSEDIPAGRSVSYTDEIFRDEFLKELETQGIKYVIKNRKNGEWIVWDEKDIENVHAARKISEQRALEKGH